MRRTLAMAFAALIISGCDPKFGAGPAGPAVNPADTQTNTGSEQNDPLPPKPVEPIRMSAQFAVSSSDTNPHDNSGTAAAGPLELYLWLVQSTHGVSALEFDILRQGADLAPAYFIPAGLNQWLTWEGSGEVVVAVADCPQQARLLGTIRLDATGEPLTISAIRTTGAVDCEQFLVHSFQCTPYTAQ